MRQHWGIENTLHWTLDVVLDEELARSRKNYAPENLAVLRRLVLNVARAHPDTRASMRAKLKRAGWDENFLLEVLKKCAIALGSDWGWLPVRRRNAPNK